MARSLSLLLALALIAAACASTSTIDSSGGGEPVDADTDDVEPANAGTDASNEPFQLEVIAPTTEGRAEIVADAPVPELADSFNQAGYDLLATQELNANAVLSPISIGHAVLMARGAADDATGAAIDNSLGLTEGSTPHDAWNTIDRAIAATNATQRAFDGEPTPIVTIADRIWPAQGTTPTQEWVDLLASRHGAEVSTIDVGRPGESTAEINQWVSNNTEGLIPDLLPDGFIDANTVLVLTDAVYFEAQWQTIFGKYGEVDADFTTLDGSTEQISLMRDLEGRGARGAGDGWTAAVLPYLGDAFSMTLVVPDEGRFEEFRDGLSNELIADIDDQIEPGPYELLLPRWENDSKIDLLPWLTDIGAAPGNYPGIGDGVFLSGGIHAADIAVDEWGTVAAAATALGFDESGPPEPEITVAADKPFLYLIRHDESGAVLFVGQVTNPNA